MINTAKYSELELITLLKNKDDSAFSYLYENYSGALYSVIVQIVADHELANDILQESFVNIWRRIDSYDQSKGRLFTWMLNVTRNLSIDTIRSKTYQNSQKTYELLQTTPIPAGGIVQQNIDNIGLKNIVDKLKEEYRTLIDLSYFKGYTHDEIAEMEGIPLGTVKTRIRTALIQLREHLK